MSTKKTEVDLTQGPIFGKIIRFTLPLIATGLLQTLYNASDMVVVGRYASDHAMGAVGACGALINLLINVFFGLAVGVGVSVAQGIGAKKYDDVEKIIHTSLIASFFCGIALGIFGFFMTEPLLKLMDTPSETLSEAVPYMKAYFVGIPASMVYNFMASALRSSGDTKRPLIILSISGLANVILNYIMVKFFSLGAVGVGVATAISQYISAVMIIIHMLKLDGCCKIRINKLRFDKSKLWIITKIGLPAGIQGTLFSLSNVIIQSTINSFGPVIVNGNSAASNIEGFIYISMNSLYQTVLTFVGQNIGAGTYERIKKIIFQCVILVTAVGFIMGMSAYIFGDTLLSIYAPESAEVRAAGMVRVSIICITYFTCGLMDVGCGVLRGMGKTILPMMVSLVGSCVFRIGWIKLIYPHFNTVRSIYVSYPISWLITATVHFSLSIYFYRKLMKSNKRELSAV